MGQKYYRAAFYQQDEFTLDTSIQNYGQNINKKHEHLFNCHFGLTSKHDLPITLLLGVNNMIANLGLRAFIDIISNEYIVNNRVDIQRITRKTQHRGLYTSISVLNAFIQKLTQVPVQVFEDSAELLWERYFESVRSQHYSHLPKRSDSIFLFDDVDICQQFIREHRGVGEIYEVDILDQKQLFKADMNIFDEISGAATHSEVIRALHIYWSGDPSKSPKYEYLFQGKCRLKMIDHEITFS